MSNVQTYKGSCHCGTVRFEVTADLSTVMACNCSLCGRIGWRLAFLPEAQFTLHSGADAVKDYQFNKKVLHHPFCTTCGVRSYSYGVGPGGQAMHAVNVRCLEGVDAESLPVKFNDGKSSQA